MSAFEEILSAFPRKRVLVVGDVMLDRFVYGSVSRISPEAPAAVINAGDASDALGGAGNVARNIVGLGAACDIVAVTGVDATADHVTSRLRAEGITPHLIRISGRPTTLKMRFVAHMHNTHLLRADWEETTPIPATAAAELLALLEQLIPSADVIVLSDYAKGVLTADVLAGLIRVAHRWGKPTVVDPKGHDFSKYAGVTALTPNVFEVRQALGRAVPDEEEALDVAGRSLLDITQARVLLLTRSEKGVLVIEPQGLSHRFESVARKVVDVSGAGDTLIASFALALAADADWANAARLANAAAGLAVAKPGTASVALHELRRDLLSRPRFAVQEKVFLDRQDLAETTDGWKRDGLVVGFTNGCFDLIHPGHVSLLRAARGTCDRLVVALNGDASVKRLKGPSRPVQQDSARLTVMAALAFVDAVIAFDEDTPVELIKFLQPQVLVKGSDYTLDQVVGRHEVESWGGRVVLADLLPDISTTRLVRRMADTQAKDLGPEANTAVRPEPAKRRQVRYPIMARLGRRAHHWMNRSAGPALFLDRDGIVIEDTGYVSRPGDVRLLPGVGPAIAEACERDIPVVLISNQSGVGRGMFGWQEVESIDETVGDLLEMHGAGIDLVVYCGLLPDEATGMMAFRKPGPAMFALAARMLSIDLGRSVMVGDQPRDLLAAAQAGVAAGLLLGDTERLRQDDRWRDFNAFHAEGRPRAEECIQAAVAWISVRQDTNIQHAYQSNLA